MTHIEGLKRWDKDLYDGIVYDEVMLLHRPREEQIYHASVTAPVDIFCRFHNAALDAGRRVVFTTNRYPAEVILFDDPAIRRRVQVVKVNALNDYEPWPLDSSGPRPNPQQRQYTLVQ